jgi:hypothetical protein
MDIILEVYAFFLALVVSLALFAGVALAWVIEMVGVVGAVLGLVCAVSIAVAIRKELKQ